jgi:choline dehydrogenase-like flavoprotein
MGSIDRRFDVIVIGSGAGGSVAVKELTERGLDVLLVEAGRDLTDAVPRRSRSALEGPRSRRKS